MDYLEKAANKQGIPGRRQKRCLKSYPENWKHAVVHFNPETKSIHFDSTLIAAVMKI